MTTKLEQVVIQSNSEQAKYVIIWLHGLGADGNDFVPIMQELSVVQSEFKFILPHAPIIPISVNGGNKARGWFDIKNIDFKKDIDFDGIANSVDQTIAIYQSCLDDGFTKQNIFIGGFSQGGIIALETAMQLSKLDSSPLAAVIGLSTFLPVERIRAVKCPIFVAHGLLDNVIPVELAESFTNEFDKQQQDLSYYKYNMEHSVCLDEIEDLSSFINQIIDNF